MLRHAYRLLRQAAEACYRDNTPLLAAALSFYTLLSTAPALWVLLALAGTIAGRVAVRDQILDWANRTAGARGAQFLAEVAAQADSSSRLATAVGLLWMFFGATLVFGALHDSLNRIWHVPPVEGRHWIRGFLIKRLLGFLLVLLVGALILASVLVHAAARATARFLPAYLPLPARLVDLMDFLLSFAIMVVLFAGIYRFLHDRAIQWHDVWVGAGVTAMLFALGKTLIGWYLGSAAISSAYGAAGSLVVLLLWVYYSAQIFLFGAEFTEVYARHRVGPRTA
jgi:membrane protein